ARSPRDARLSHLAPGGTDARARRQAKAAVHDRARRRSRAHAHVRRAAEDGERSGREAPRVGALTPSRPEIMSPNPPRLASWLLCANQQSFEDIALFTPYDRNLTGAGDPERIHGEVIGTHYLSVLGVSPQLGRDFQPEEDLTPGGPAIVLLGHALWKR